MFELDKIDEYLIEANRRLHEVAGVHTNLQKICNDLEAIKKNQESSIFIEFANLKRDIEIIKEILTNLGGNINLYDRDLNYIRRKLESDEWPQAVNSAIICKTEEELEQRAENIIKVHIHDFMRDTRFLDFGCGTGHVVKAAKKFGAKIAVGYDIEETWKVDNNGEVIFTKVPNEVRSNGPYDVVLMFDVLDHMLDDPIRILKEIKQILSPNGKIYIRNHPWCARHGSHLYEQLNKAFIHVIFDDLELTRIGGLHPQYVRKLTKPIDIYHYWFKEAGLNIKHEIILREPVEDFFVGPANIEIKKRIDDVWEGDDPLPHLSISHVNYILTATSNNQIF